MGIVKKIHESYNILFDLKKEFNQTLVNEADDVYNNLNFENINQGNPANDNINIPLLQDVQNAAQNAGVVVSVTTAISGHDTTSPSRHPSGNAVDIAKINGRAVSLSNRGDADKFVNALVSMGYVKNQESSNPKAVLSFGFPGHDNHVHVSNTTNQSSTSGGSSSGNTTNSGSTENNNSSKQTRSYDKNDLRGDSEFIKSVATPMLQSYGLKEEKIYSSHDGKIKKIKENINRIKGLLK